MPPLPTERAILGVPGPVFFGLLVLLAVAAFVYSMSRRVRVLFATAPENRFDRIGTRIWKTIEYAFLQKRRSTRTKGARWMEEARNGTRIAVRTM